MNFQAANKKSSLSLHYLFMINSYYTARNLFYFKFFKEALIVINYGKKNSILFH